MAQNTIHKPRPANDPVDPTEHGTGPDQDRVDAHAGEARSDAAYVVDSNGEVRAGPGDAGAQTAPRVLDDPQDKPKRGRGPLIALLVAGPVLLVVIWMLTA